MEKLLQMEFKIGGYIMRKPLLLLFVTIIFTLKKSRASYKPDKAFGI